MRFIDASVFIYAYLRPTKKLSSEMVTTKNNARKIIGRISAGEPATTSLVHVSEIANILEARMPLPESLELLSGLLDLSNLFTVDPTKRQYASALEEARSANVGVNDALACLLMRDLDINEIYSFDSDFDRIEGIARIVE